MSHYLYYRHGVRTENKVALTFDDGPNPPRTEQILAILAQAGVQATFFLMGKWVVRFPETVRRIIAAGHLIGNHGYAGQSRIGDYDEAEVAIAHLTGEPCRYLRPHTYNYGAFFQSVVSHLPEALVIDADVGAHDWRFAYDGTPLTSADEIVRNVLDHPSLGPGSIVELHDGTEMEDASMRLLRPRPTIEALPRIIAGLKERKLQCVRLDEMTLAAPTPWTPTPPPSGNAVSPDR